MCGTVILSNSLLNINKIVFIFINLVIIYMAFVRNSAAALMAALIILPPKKIICNESTTTHREHGIIYNPSATTIYCAYCPKCNKYLICNRLK